MIHTLPKEFREEYFRERGSIVRARVSLYFVVTTILYTLLTTQYFFRQYWTDIEIFRPSELWLLIVLCVFAVSLYFLNRRSMLAHVSKIYAWIYTLAMLFSMSGYGTIYCEHAFLFAFYFGCSQLLVSLMIPWSVKETVFLSALYASVFAAFSLYLNYIVDYSIMVFPRFHPFFDGIAFMGTTTLISVVVRYKDNRHNLNNFVLLKRLELQSRQMEKELTMADRIHKTLIPVSISQDRVDIAVTYIPMHYIGGDCAKFRFVDEDRLVIFISDVTGHGVPAALLVNRVHAEFERLVRENPQPPALLKSLNRFIAKDFEGTEMYLSAFCGLVDFKHKTFSYSNYGHPTQYLYRISSSEVQSLPSHTSFLGILFDENESYEGRTEFKSGDNFLLFTDGVLETVSASGEFYGEKRLREFMHQNSNVTANTFNENLVSDLRRFSQAEFNDDIFILNVKTKP